MTPPRSEIVVYSLSNVWLSYEESSVLKGVEIDIFKGEVFVILGPSGEGKSSLLKMMAGLRNPSEGVVRFCGVDLRTVRGRNRSFILRRIGMTFQKSGLFDSLSCGDNLRFPLKMLTSLKSFEIEARVDRFLSDVGLSGTKDLMISEISGGMQKRLGIARALILFPEVVLYDDPTAGLDPITSKQIVDLILEMKNKYHMTIVLVTNDITRAFELSNRMGFLYGGDFIKIGTPKELGESHNPVISQFIRGDLQGPLTQTGIPEGGRLD